jgi:hypothetical protein
MDEPGGNRPPKEPPSHPILQNPAFASLTVAREGTIPAIILYLNIPGDCILFSLFFGGNPSKFECRNLTAYAGESPIDRGI